MSSNIFGGSHFPGSISFGEDFNSTGNYGLPGIQGFTTHGNSSSFGVGWSALLPNLPPVNVQYSQTSSTSTVFGTDQQNQAIMHNLGVNSNYRIAGWSLWTRFSDVFGNTQVPQFLTAGESTTSNTDSKTFAFNANHKLPLQGSGSLGYSRSSFDGSGNGTNVSGSTNDYSGSASFTPVQRFSTLFGLQYTDNLQASVEQQLAAAGSLAPQVNLGLNSHSLSFYNSDSLYIIRNLSASFNFNRFQQVVYGESVDVNHYSGILNYRFNKPLWGSLVVYGGVTDDSTDAGHQGTGLVAGANFSRLILGWNLGASFGYSQDVQTVLATTTTSSYTYQASARRKIRRNLIWNTTFTGYRTGLSVETGQGSHSEAYNSTLLYKGYSLNGNYTNSTGTALITAGGAVATPVIIPVTLLGTNQYLLVDGSSYSVSASANPLRNMTITGSYGSSRSETTTPTLDSANSSKFLSIFTQYQLRKVSFNAGYTRLQQGVGASGLLPTDFTSYYFGIQRWFKAF